MSLKTVDDIDRDMEARKHLWKGLHRLGERQRTAFLLWACSQVKSPDKVTEVKVTSSTGAVHEVYMDLMQLACIYGLHLGKTCEKLEMALRRL